MTGRRTKSNSVTAAVQGFAGAIKGVDVPQGVELRSDEERVIWGQFTRARAREDWRDMDLLLLAKVVRMEADLRQYRDQLDAEGITLVNQRGTSVVNPLISIIDTIERRQLAVIRSMSLNQTAVDPRTLNAKLADIGVAGEDDLIAMPT
jgi:hypothetical protein